MTYEELNIIVGCDTDQAINKIEKLEKNLARLEKKSSSQKQVRVNTRNAEKSLTVLEDKAKKIQTALAFFKNSSKEDPIGALKTSHTIARSYKGISNPNRKVSLQERQQNAHALNKQEKTNTSAYAQDWIAKNQAKLNNVSKIVQDTANLQGEAVIESIKKGSKKRGRPKKERTETEEQAEPKKGGRPKKPSISNPNSGISQPHSAEKLPQNGRALNAYFEQAQNKSKTTNQTVRELSKAQIELLEAQGRVHIDALSMIETKAKETQSKIEQASQRTTSKAKGKINSRGSNYYDPTESEQLIEIKSPKKRSQSSAHKSLKKEEEITVQTKQAEKQLKNLQEDLTQTKQKVKETASSIKKSKFEAPTDRAQRSLKKLQNEFKATQKIASSSSNVIKGVFNQLSRYLVTLGIGQIISSSIENAMDAIEIDNLFYVSLGKYAKEANAWTQSLNKSLGINTFELKRNLGVLYAMSTSMGVSSEKAFNMSKDLTKLTYDIASLYNLPISEAFTKIKSGLVGETEPLREIGILVDENTSKMFAMKSGLVNVADGYTQTEKVMGRYAAIMGQTYKAQGDFERTLASPANQLRMLQVELKMLSVELGNCFLPIAEIVLPILRQFVTTLSTVLAYVSEFMRILFGTSYTMSQGNAGFTDLGNSAIEAGDKIDKAGKKARNGVMKFDEVNTITQNTSVGDGGGGTDNGFDFGNQNDSFEPPEITFNPAIIEAVETFKRLLNEIMEVIERLKQKAKELASIFMSGFKLSFDTEALDFSTIMSDLTRIAELIKNLFSPEVLESMSGFETSFIGMLGSLTGLLATMGVTLAELFIGGFTLFLEQNTPLIQEKLTSIFDIWTSVNILFTNLFSGISEIFTVFSNDSAKQIVANMMGAFTSAALSFIEIGSKVGRDILSGITTCFSNNKALIKTAFEQILEVLSTLSSTFKIATDDIFSSFNESYDKYIAPSIKSFSEAISNLGTALLKFFNTQFSPVLQDIAKRFDTLYKESIQPFISNTTTCVSTLWELLVTFFTKCIIEPCTYLVTVFGPAVSTVMSIVYDCFDTTIRFVLGLVEGLLTALSGLAEFLVGGFTGDWERAWKGIVSFMEGISKSISSLLNAPINLLITGINTVIRGINRINLKIPDWFENIPGLKNLAGKNFGFSLDTIPMLARGGIIDHPTLAMVGEAGKEMVVPLENTAFVDKLASALGNAVLQAMQLSSSSQTMQQTPTILELDGIEIARSLITPLQKELRRTGVSL